MDQEQSWLQSFIRRRAPDPGDVAEIRQDVFYELVVAAVGLGPMRPSLPGFALDSSRDRRERARTKLPKHFRGALSWPAPCGRG